MDDLHLRATQRPDYDEPVGEVWNGAEFLGQIYWDGEAAMFQMLPTGGPQILDVDELLDLLAEARDLVAPEGLRPVPDPDAPAESEEEAPSEVIPLDSEWEPTNRLVTEFDPLAAHRDEYDQGYFRRDVAARFVKRCNDLDLAVVLLEGFDLRGGELGRLPHLKADLAAAHAGENWELFRASCNVQAEGVLQRWTGRRELVIGIEVMEPSGESFVA